MFGKYEILSLIGTGSFSQVYLARHIKLKAFRAIKCISKTHSLQPQLSQKADLFKDLNHPGIPQIYDIEEDKDNIYVIEEYIQGESLQVYLKEKRILTYQEFLQFGVEICEILEYLHHLPQGPVINPDLKPEHFIICDSGIKLIDFGVIGQMNHKEPQPYGTKKYSPPEWRKEGRCTVKSDVYGLGKVMGEIAGEYHFFKKPHLKKIIQKASAQEEDERFETITQLKELWQKELQKKMKEQLSVKTGHLSKTVAVIGSQTRVGTTHVAVALTCTGNHLGINSVYKENPSQPWLRKTQLFHSRHILCKKNNFQGLPAYGKGIQIPLINPGLLVSDLGTLENWEEELEDYDLVILVIGGRDWEEEKTAAAIEEAGGERVVILCNFSTGRKAKEYARITDRQVYCFPPDENPYKVTKEKIRLLTAMLEKRR